MKCALIVSFLLLFPAAALATTWYVPDDFPTIQAAINSWSVVNGDTVIVRPGTYVENITFAGKAITLKSEKGPELTAIDGNQAGNVVTLKSGEGPDSVLDGFTVTNGLTNYGPAIYCQYSSPTLRNNIITGNYAWYHSGAIYAEGASPIISDNIICDNLAEYSGGGIYCKSNSAPLIVGNMIYMNTALYRGGGIYCEESEASILNNMIFDNWAGYYGGGIHYRDTATASVTNNTVFGNFADYEGGGVSCENSSPVIMNMIIWDNDSGSGSNREYYFYSGANPELTYSDVKGGAPGTGNIDADPLFVDAAGRDFHLTLESPCRDAGSNITYPRDFEGDPRVVPTLIDMGADEFYYHLYMVGDVIPGGSIDVRVVGIPAMPVLLGLGSGVQDPPQSTIYGDLYLQLPLVASWNLPVIPAEGVLNFAATVPASWNSGDQYPFQALVGPLGNPSSTLTNLTVLTVD